MLPTFLMLQRVLTGIKTAAKNRDFIAVLITGAFLILIGTLTYSITQGWSMVDAFYFAVCTLTTSSIEDPKLTLTGPWIKLFTSFYILVGIGILVEIARQIGLGYIKAHKKTHKRS